MLHYTVENIDYESELVQKITIISKHETGRKIPQTTYLQVQTIMNTETNRLKLMLELMLKKE